MRQLKIFIFFISTLCLLVSCHTKASHIQDFDDFVTNVEQKSETYSDADWMAAESEFNRFVEVTVEQYGSKLTPEDQKRLGEIEKRYWRVRMFKDYRSIALPKEGE